jgi:hypothetical protein
VKRDDFFCAEAVGIGLVKLTLYGKSPGRGGESGAAEVILDEDDLEELIEDLRRAARAKVTIS